MAEPQAVMPKFKCNRCLSSKNRPAPIFREATWLKLARRNENLCAECAFARARKRRVALAVEDLQPCAFNLEGRKIDRKVQTQVTDRNAPPLRWLDIFLSARPSDTPFSSECAHEWKRAIVTYTAQINAGPMPQNLASVGKVLAAEQHGLTLREAPEGGIYGWSAVDWANGQKYLKVVQPNGEAVEVFICFDGTGMYLRDIIAPRGPASLGTVKARSIFRLLQRAYPDIEMLSGIRMSGARRNKPRQLAFSLRRIAGFNIAMPEQTMAAKR